MENGVRELLCCGMESIMDAVRIEVRKYLSTI